MSKKTICIILGIWIAVLPFLGLPVVTKGWLITISGLAVAIIAYLNAKPVKN